ncbi:methyltransferase [Nocardia sp. NPDC058658]|uniref:class I SAM-dependent methyltransferase n=1 Tax=Nocardia sp. NPDC058658 TaxID=3346580 RepID=UPI00366528AA
MHAVLYPPEEVAVGSGDDVIYIDVDAHLAVILAELERRTPTKITLPSALLWRLCAEPAAFMTDLSSIREVVHLGPPPSERELSCATEVFGSILVHVPEPGAVGDGARVVAAARAAADTVVAGIADHQVAEYVSAIRVAELGSMLFALQRHGVLDDPARVDSCERVLVAADVAAEHHAVIRRWLRGLTENGVLVADGDDYRGTRPVRGEDLRDAWRRVHHAWTGVLGPSAFVDYLEVNALRLDDLMSGRDHAVELLFPHGRTDIADAVYRDTVTARYLNSAIAAAVAELAAQRPLRILEVGAGTGATTEAVAAALGPDPRVDYLFTDVSRFFLATAKGRLAEYPWIDYGLLDIDAIETTRSYDVIIAAGVLNNARNTDETVAALIAALAPGGWLLITEPVLENLEILGSQAFMMTRPTDARAASQSTFLSEPQWLEVLSGLAEVAVLPDAGHPLAPLGQRLFLGRRS